MNLCDWPTNFGRCTLICKQLLLLLTLCYSNFDFSGRRLSKKDIKVAVSKNT